VRTANPEDPEEPYGVAWETAAERVWGIAKRGVAETAEQHLAAEEDTVERPLAGVEDIAESLVAAAVESIAKRQLAAAVDGIAALQMAVVVETGSVKLMSVRAPATILLA
jgi:hypothetical protein